MARLIHFTEKDHEFVVIDTADLSNADLENEYGATINAVVELDADDYVVNSLPTDRALYPR